jgi:hypothetical protein
LLLVPNSINGDFLQLAEKLFGNKIKVVTMANDSPAYQLDKFAQSKEVISSKKFKPGIKAKKIDVQI